MTTVMLNENLAIIIHDNGYDLAERKKKKNQKTKEVEYIWSPYSFHSSLDAAIKRAVRACLSDKNLFLTAHEFSDKYKEIEKSILNKFTLKG